MPISIVTGVARAIIIARVKISLKESGVATYTVSIQFGECSERSWQIKAWITGPKGRESFDSAQRSYVASELVARLRTIYRNLQVKKDEVSFELLFPVGTRPDGRRMIWATVLLSVDDVLGGATGQGRGSIQNQFVNRAPWQ